MGQQAQLDLGIVSREKHGARRSDEGAANGLAARGTHGDVLQVRVGGRQPSRGGTGLIKARMDASGLGRSEEHTSELQSRLHLVCRLLLEKKKNESSRTSAAMMRSMSGPVTRHHLLTF